MKAKIWSIWYELDRGLSRTVSDNHDTRLRGLFSTRQQQSIGAALAWTDEHRCTEAEGRVRAFDERCCNNSGRMSRGWQQAKTRAGSAQRVVGVKASSWDSFCRWSRCTRLRCWNTRWRGGGNGRSSSSQTKVVGTWSFC